MTRNRDLQEVRDEIGAQVRALARTLVNEAHLSPGYIDQFERIILAAISSSDDTTRRSHVGSSATEAHEHYWTDAPDDETGWHCTICGVTEYPSATETQDEERPDFDALDDGSDPAGRAAAEKYVASIAPTPDDKDREVERHPFKSKYDDPTLALSGECVTCGVTYDGHRGWPPEPPNWLRSGRHG